MAWWSFRVGKGSRVSRRGLSVGAGRLRVGSSWPKLRMPSTPKGSQQRLRPRDDRRVEADLNAEQLAWLATQPEDVKVAGVEAELAVAKKVLGDAEVAAAEAMSEDEVDAAMAEEIRIMKSQDPRGWVRLLAALPAEERAKMREVERKFNL